MTTDAKRADLLAILLPMEDFINEPRRGGPQPEPMDTRDYRHEAYRVWSEVRDAILAALNEAPQPGREAELGAKIIRLEGELDRFRRPSARSLSTSDPIIPLENFQPQHLRGLALLFREWCHSDLWGGPQEAELAARQVETAYAVLTSPNAAGETRGGEALSEAMDDLRTHRLAWRDALVLARDFASEGSEDPEADRSYWNYVLRAYDRTFAALAVPAPAKEHS